MNNVDVIHRQSEFFGYDLGNDGVRTLPHIGGTGENIHLAVVIHLDNAPAAVGFINPGSAAHMNERCHANAFAGLFGLIPR